VTPSEPGHEPDQDPRRDDENLPPTHQPYGRPPAPQNPYGAPSYPPPPASNPYGSGEDQPQQPPYGQNPYGQNPYDQGAYDQNPYDQGAYGQQPYDQGSSDPQGYAQPGSPYGQGEAPAGYGYAAPYGYGAAPQNHPSATTALVLSLIGLAGIVFCFGLTLVLSPFAWRIGASAVREIDASQGRLGGRDQANAGRIMGIIGTVLLALGILLVLGLVALLAAGSTGEYSIGTRAG
jgi:hypothetical protein